MKENLRHKWSGGIKNSVIVFNSIRINSRGKTRKNGEEAEFKEIIPIKRYISCILAQQGLSWAHINTHTHTHTYIYTHHAAAAKSLQSWPTLCDLIDGSPPGSPVPGILQARTLEWVAISFSNA